jgi:hypothetical protein
MHGSVLVNQTKTTTDNHVRTGHDASTIAFLSPPSPPKVLSMSALSAPVGSPPPIGGGASMYHCVH